MVMEAFLINPPKRRKKTIKRSRSRRYSRNPLGVEELVVLNPPKKRKRRKRTVRLKRDSKGRFLKKGRKVSRRRTRRTTARRTVRRFARRHGARRVRSLRRHSVYVTNPPRRRRRYRRNPGLGKLGFSMSSIMPTLKQGAFIALGAAAVSQAMARLPWFSTQTGPTRHVARLGLAILGGTVIAKYFNRDLGKAFAMGGVVTTVMALGQESLPAVFTPVSGDMALGMYYAESPMALGEYYSSGPSVAAQPDGLSWDADMPARLDPAQRY